MKYHSILLCLFSASVLAVPAPAPADTALTPTATSCTCPFVACALVWPQSCYCQNQAKIDCYKLCGGVLPPLQSCPPLAAVSSTTETTTTTTTATKPPVPCSTTADCPSANHTCISGLCLTQERGCGGFTGAPCEVGVCVDDPRDSCDPENGGNDCGGVCV